MVSRRGINAAKNIAHYEKHLRNSMYHSISVSHNPYVPEVAEEELSTHRSIDGQQTSTQLPLIRIS